jgi:autotransporter-associated beta strand protein
MLRKSIFTSLLGIAAWFTAPLVEAATIEKTNNLENLNLGSSWIGGVLPGAGDIASWNTNVAAANTVLLGANLPWAGIRVLHPGGLVTLSAGNTLTLGSSGVDMGGATTDLVVNCGLALSANQAWNITTERRFTVGGVISGAGITLEKNGAGEALLGAANTFTGSVRVNTGKLILSNPRALGYASASVGFQDQLEAAAAGTYTNALTITGNGTDNQGALNFNGGAITWSGPITLAGDARIGSYGGSGNFTLSGGIAGTGSLRFWAGGASSTHLHAYTLSAPCSYTGRTELDTYAASTIVTLSGGGNTLPTNSVVHMLAGYWNGQSLVATLKLNGNSQTIAGLVSGGGTHGTGGTNRVLNGSATHATLTLTNAKDQVFDGYLGGSTADERNFSLVKSGPGSQVFQKVANYSGSTAANEGLIFFNSGIGSGAVSVNDGAGLILGPGAFTVSSLSLSNTALLGVSLGAANSTVLQVNGNLVLGGRILVQDLGGIATNNFVIINYTGALTYRGMTTDPRSQYAVTVDTNTPGKVKLVLGASQSMIALTNGNFTATTTSTNIGGILRGFPTLPLWFELRDQTNRLWDYGSLRAVSPWSFTARHLRPGTNTLTVFARNTGGVTVSNTIQIALLLGSNPPVRPRPQPAEIWWGGSCHDNLYSPSGGIVGTYSRMEQLTNTAGWDFVKAHQDGFILHGYIWINDSAKMVNWMEVGQAIGDQLAPRNGRYLAENGWRPATNNLNYGHSSASQQDGEATDLLKLGMVVSEYTMDYNPLWRDFSEAYTTWPTNDIRVLGTGNTNQASAAYPYDSGQWRDYALDFHALRPDIRFGWTWSPVWFHWSNGPSLGADSGVFTINRGGTNYNFNWDFYHWMLDAQIVGQEAGVPFAFASDIPWDYFGENPGNPGGWSASHQFDVRKKVRDYEAWLQSRGLRHSLICNSSDNGSTANPDAYDSLYKTNSLKSIYLHQAEGGRASRYLFESWYTGPFSVLPESKEGSYANLAMHAIKYLKGVRDPAGTLEDLQLTVLGTGAVYVVELRNNGDVACMPALLALESGAAIVNYSNAAGADISTAIRTAEGYACTNLLQPGQATTFRIAVSGTPAPNSKTVTLEAFWNPQDPTGVVRDRVTLTLPPAQAAFGGVRASLPGTVQIEDYDLGGEMVAYHDDTYTNLSGACRPYEGVDLEGTSDTGGGYNLGNARAGEWLEYTVNALYSGTYQLEARVASTATGGSFRVEVDGANTTGSLSVPNTGAWQNFATVARSNLTISAGQHVLRLYLEANGSGGFAGNFNWLRFTFQDSANPTATYTWTSASGGPWSSGANWLSSSPPPTGGNSNGTVRFTASGSYSASNNLAGSFNLNILDLANLSTLPSSIAGNPLRFVNSTSSGAGPQLMQSGSSSVTISNPLTLAADLSLNASVNAGVTFGGTVSGTGALIKNGSHMVTLAAANSHTGGTFVNSGVLQVGGSLTGAVSNNATLRFFPPSGTTIAATGNIIGAGAIIKDGTDSAAVLSGSNSFSGKVTIIQGRLEVTHPNALGSIASLTEISGDTNTGSLALSGNITTAEPLLWNQKAFTNSGVGPQLPHLLNVSGINSVLGLVRATGGGNYWGAASASGKLILNLISNDAAGFTCPVYLSGAGDGEIGDMIDLSLNWLGVRKYGTGTWSLRGVAQLPQGAQVFEGSFLVNGTLAKGASAGAVSVSGGRLGGHGTILGPVTIQSGGTLAPGNGSIGRLTVSNNLTFQPGSFGYLRLDKSAGTNDQLQGISLLTLGGSLTVTNVAGTLAAGDAFQLLGANTILSNFASVTLPTLPSGLAWEDRLNADGSLRVVNLAPVALAGSVTLTNTLVLTWPGTVWQLQSQTNDISQGLGSNWFDCPSSTSPVVVPLGGTTNSVFYRLRN